MEIEAHARGDLVVGSQSFRIGVTLPPERAVAEAEHRARLKDRIGEDFFCWCYDGNNSVFNTIGYKSPEMDKLIDGARTAAAIGDTAAYNKDVNGFVDLAYAAIPRIPLYQPFVNTAMQKNISGYQYWFHRRLDYRALVKA